MVHPPYTPSRTEAKDLWLWATSEEITPTQRLVLLAYVGVYLFEPECVVTNNDGYRLIMLTNADLVSRTGLSRRAVQKARIRLIQDGYLYAIMVSADEKPGAIDGIGLAGPGIEVGGW